MVNGLKNLGNTCFINSGMQCLAAFPEFIDLLTIEAAPGPVTSLMAHVLKEVNDASPPGNCSTILHLVKYLQDHMMCKHNEQGDTQEFILRILDRIHKECFKLHPHLTAQKEQVTTRSQHLRSIMETHWSYACTRDGGESAITRMWYGQYVSQVQCNSCKNITYSPEIFASINLMPPPNIRHATLKDCMTHYFAPETVEGFQCDACKRITLAEKTVRLWKLPRVLMIAMPPYMFQGFKVDCVQDIDVSKYCLDTEQQSSFSIQAVTSHVGNVHGGHYCATRKDATHSWHEFDDEVVKKAHEMSFGRPYLLFFKQNQLQS